jgi:hypothetical protein
MKPVRTVVAWAAASALLVVPFAADASAQSATRWRGSQGWGRGSEYVRLYDAKTVETIKGEVVRVRTFTPGKGMSSGVHLELKTDVGMLPVHLGPSWYIENQDTGIEARDIVEVMGSRVVFDGQLALIAAEVRKGEGALRLRDQDGYPAWAGWRAR